MPYREHQSETIPDIMAQVRSRFDAARIELVALDVGYISVGWFTPLSFSDGSFWVDGSHPDDLTLCAAIGLLPKLLRSARKKRACLDAVVLRAREHLR